jgi:hypothetical protein
MGGQSVEVRRHLLLRVPRTGLHRDAHRQRPEQPRLVQLRPVRRDPRTDRWTQEDPLNDPLSYEQADRYAYVNEDPINRTDESGLLSFHDVVKTVVGGATAIGGLALFGGAIIGTGACIAAEEGPEAPECIGLGLKVGTVGAAGVVLGVSLARQVFGDDERIRRARQPKDKTELPASPGPDPESVPTASHGGFGYWRIARVERRRRLSHCGPSCDRDIRRPLGVTAPRVAKALIRGGHRHQLLPPLGLAARCQR